MVYAVHVSEVAAASLCVCVCDWEGGNNIVLLGVYVDLLSLQVYFSTSSESLW
jgi:hypothetical protein